MTGGRLARINFLGAASIAAITLFFLLLIEIGGVKLPWSHPVVPVLFRLNGVPVIFFIITEAWWAKEPIFPLQLLR